MKSELPVLISGETGTGKTQLAQKIHQGSGRSNGPFITVNLGSLHEGTLESELFGNEKGAFTGADYRRKGWLECAHGGTVFLDEVGELSLRYQSRLLEFLQSQRVFPLGSREQKKLDVRVIAATNQNLLDGVKKGIFREDLLHRLRVISIHLKPLRERADEFREITASIFSSLGHPSAEMDQRLYEKLSRCFWPGNIRELKSVLEFALASSGGKVITDSDLPDWFQLEIAESFLSDAESLTIPLQKNYHQTMGVFDRIYLETLLRNYGGRINFTAKEAGLSKTTLCKKIRLYEIDLDSMRKKRKH